MSVRTAASATRPRHSSPPRVLLTLRLRLRSSSTREPKTGQLLPKPYSHSTWHNNLGHSSNMIVPRPELASSLIDYSHANRYVGEELTPLRDLKAARNSRSQNS